MTTVATSGGVRAYARHRGCSHKAVQNAIRRGRLDKSVVGGRVTDFALADREWELNRLRLRPPAADEDRDLQARDIRALEVDQGQLSVTRCGATLVFGCLQPDGAAPDPDASFVVPMSAGTARSLAARLIDVASAIEGAQER